MIEKVLQTGEHEIFYRVAGKGKPVVFIHGFGEDGRIWDVLVSDLKNKVTCIVPDLAGSGKSLIKNGGCSMEGLAECIKSIFDHEEIKTATVIGHSMGGYVTLAFAEKYSSLLQSFGLFHSSAFADSEEKKAVRRRGIQFIEEHGAVKFLEQSTTNLFSEDFKGSHPDIVTELISRYTNFQDGALVHYYEAMTQRPDRTHILKNFQGPVLFLLGEHDSAIPLADGLRQCHLASLSYIHILRNSGHMGMIEETDKCRGILQKFLLDHDTGLPAS
jgi:pimeloyl-ACP methyl ester carboxylesterase